MLKTGAWKGEPCFLVGNGPSREGLDLRRIRERRVIACNVAAFEVRSDIALVMDRRVVEKWKLAWDAIHAVGTQVVMPQAAAFDDTLPPWIVQAKVTPRHNWSESFEEGICWHSDAGLTALSVAYILGADPIYLIGIDLKDTPDKLTSNAGGLYPEDWRTNAKDCYLRMREAWESHAKEATNGRRVVNLNPESGLRCFEFGSFEEAVK